MRLTSPVKFVTDVSGRNPFYCMQPESTLRDAMEYLSAGVKRLPIIIGGDMSCEPDQLTGILSQSQVIRYLAKSKLDSLGKCVVFRSGEKGRFLFFSMARVEAIWF